MEREKLLDILAKHKLWCIGTMRGQRADLRGADLREADLQRTNLQRADLRGAYLQGADLQKADLREADLQGADLREADLQRADLQGADLQRADLRGAYLREADLRGASLQGTLLAARTPNEFLCNLKTKNSKLIAYKGVQSDGTNYQGNMQYFVGEEYEETMGSGDILTECHPGLHLCKTPNAARKFGSRVLECAFDIGDVISIPAEGVSETKFRVRKFVVIGDCSE